MIQHVVSTRLLPPPNRIHQPYGGNARAVRVPYGGETCLACCSTLARYTLDIPSPPSAASWRPHVTGDGRNKTLAVAPAAAPA